MTIKIDKIVFTQEDIDKKLNNMKIHVSVMSFSRNLEDQQYFEPGQVLVCRHVTTSYRGEAGSLVKNDSGAVQKYIVANKLPGNLVLCRKLGISGRPGKAIHVIADTDRDRINYEEDPDIADSILLDFDYDPLQGPKMMGKARRERQQFNNNISVESAAKKEFDTKYLSDKSTLKYLNNRIDIGKMILWHMNGEVYTKCRYVLLSADESGVKIRKEGTTDISTFMPWQFSTRRYGGFFISEPMTQEGALLKVKSKRPR